MGDIVPAIDLRKLCEAMGIAHVYEVDAFDTLGLEKRLKEETQREAVSVIIAKSPCALLKTTISKGKRAVIPEACKKCGQCLVPGCPAMTKDSEGRAVIDEVMCNGCGLCMQRCPFEAISFTPNANVR